MLPAPEECWLADADDERYVAELRMVAVDRRVGDHLSHPLLERPKRPEPLDAPRRELGREQLVGHAGLRPDHHPAVAQADRPAGGRQGTARAPASTARRRGRRPTRSPSSPPARAPAHASDRRRPRGTGRSSPCRNGACRRRTRRDPPRSAGRSPSSRGSAHRPPRTRGRGASCTGACRPRTAHRG